MVGLRAKVLGRVGRTENSPSKSVCSILPLARHLPAGASFGVSRPLSCPSAARLFTFPLRVAFALSPSFASVARDLGRCDHDYLRWGAHSSYVTTHCTHVLGAPASIIGSELPQLPAYGLRPLALPHPDALSPLPASPAVLAHNTRRYGHPLAGGLGLPGPGISPNCVIVYCI
jgi:hypothetical protein